ncbi:MAG: hypothetical protein ACKPER_26835, partial [Dolichospermum sp.]
GVYYLKVFGHQNATNPDYSLLINAPESLGGNGSIGTGGNNDKTNAFDLRNVEGFQTWDTLSINTAGDQDWFKFRLGTTGSEGNFLKIAFTHSLGDVDVKLYNASNVEV